MVVLEMLVSLFREEPFLLDNDNVTTAQTINDLPDELLARIFGYLHPVIDQRPLLAFVCQKWRDVLHHHGCLWRNFHVDPTSFVYWHYSLICSIFRMYGHHIQTLTWRESSPVYESVFSLIPRLRNLRSLRLPILWTRAVVESLSSLTCLEQVQINGGFAITDEELEIIGENFSNLKEISLNACWRVTSDGVCKLLAKLTNIESVKLKVNSSLPLSDPRSEESMSRGYEIVQSVSRCPAATHIKVLCLHFVPITADDLWVVVKKMENLRKLSISNCERLSEVRLASESLQKVCMFNLWSVTRVNIHASSLRNITIEHGLESLEQIDIQANNLRRAVIDGNNILRTLKIRSQKLTFLEICRCEDIDMRTFRDTLRKNTSIACLRLGCISQDSLTFDEYIVPALQELCLLGDFSCETVHVRSPTLRLLHVEAENDIVTLNHMYITANHICKVALVGMPALKTLTIQCVSVDAIEMNLCSDDQLHLESCVIHAMNAIGFLRLFDCKVNLLSVSTPLARTIVLYRCQMSDYVLQMALTGCPNISYLNLEKCREISKVAIQAPPMKFLNMFGCSDLSRLDLNNCPQLLAVNLGQCPNIRLFIRGIEQNFSAICTSLRIVKPSDTVRWSHDFPPQAYFCD